MVAIGAQGISLVLTPAQVAQVIQAASGGKHPLLLSDPEGIRALLASPLLHDPKISTSLLCGLLILDRIPSDGSERANKQIADEIGLSASTTHRYLQTLVVAGLLEQDEITRRYRRPLTSRHGRRGRRRG
jgi:IclR helix-turn-helix domain